MRRALYNRDTLNVIRLRTERGDGVLAIAHDIGWSSAELRVVAKRHDIVVIEDGQVAKSLTAAPAKKPEVLAKHKSRGRLRADAIAKHPRSLDVLMKISEKARLRLAQLGAEHGQAIGTLAAIAIDHAARHGKIEALIGDALTEIEAQP